MADICCSVHAAACGWDQQVMEETVLAIAKILMDAAKVSIFFTYALTL